MTKFRVYRVHDRKDLGSVEVDDPYSYSALSEACFALACYHGSSVIAYNEEGGKVLTLSLEWHDD